MPSLRSGWITIPFVYAPSIRILSQLLYRWHKSFHLLLTVLFLFEFGMTSVPILSSGAFGSITWSSNVRVVFDFLSTLPAATFRLGMFNVRSNINWAPVSVTSDSLEWPSENLPKCTQARHYSYSSASNKLWCNLDAIISHLEVFSSE